jgi:hypothetical protein
MCNYIFGLYGNSVSSLEYKALKSRMVSKEMIGKDVEANDHSLIWNTILAFAW